MVGTPPDAFASGGFAHPTHLDCFVATLLAMTHHIYPANHFAGTVTSCGKITIRDSTVSFAIMNGQTPLMICSMLIPVTPPTTLSTTPTGGVTRPMALLMMNSTPKYTGSMPAALTTGISTGVMIKMVGVMSIAVPTAITSTMIAISSSVGLPMNGSSSEIICAGMLATVMSH